MNYWYYFYAALMGVFLMFFIMLFCFECYIEHMSKKMEGQKFGDKTYFFMTQDQIQNACKSIIKSFPEDFKNE